MKIFVVDAFTKEKFSGNQAGVVLLGGGEDYPAETFMKQLACELKHSETVFVKQLEEKRFQLRYFTPTDEVNLCGHATIAAFSVMKEEGIIQEGRVKADTLAGELEVEWKGDLVWIDMAQPVLLREFNREESQEIYVAFGLTIEDAGESLLPKIINTGLNDIIVPIASKERLDSFMMNRENVMRLSQKYNVVGMHLFYYPNEEEITAYCRNVAPLFGIDEECATGTANAALTHYLNLEGLIEKDGEKIFIQGESMGRTSVIKSCYKGNETIAIGGSAVVSLECTLR